MHSHSYSTTDGIDVVGKHDGLVLLDSNDASAEYHFLVWLQLQSGRLVSQVAFKRVVLMLIFATTILLAVRTVDTLSDNTIAAIDDVLNVLLWIFTLELVTQVAFYQRRVLCTGWLLVDMVVVTIAWCTGDATCLVLRGFRLLRALRKATGIPALKWAVKAMLRVLPRLAAVVMVLLPGMFAIFAILFTNLYGDAEDVSRPYFYRLDAAAWTLFEILTGGREWAEIAAELENQYPFSWAPLMLFVSVSLFVFGTLIVAIMCDAVSTINREQVWKTLDHRVHGSNSSRGGDHPHYNHHSHSQRMGYYSMDDGLVVPHSSSDLLRLERKMDELASTVDSLVRMQMALQETVHHLARQQQQQQAYSSDAAPAGESQRHPTV